jgi:hypothetical protein
MPDVKFVSRVEILTIERIRVRYSTVIIGL